MLTPETLLNEIKTHLELTGIKERAFAKAAVNNTRFMKRLRKGSAELTTAQQVMRCIILTEAEMYLRRECISEASLGEIACNDPDIVMKIRRGAVISPLLAWTFLEFMRRPPKAGLKPTGTDLKTTIATGGSFESYAALADDGK